MRRILLALALLGACSSGDGGGTTTTAGAPTSTTEPTTTTTSLVAAAGECGLHGSYPEPWPERPRYRVTLEVDPPGGHLSGFLQVRFSPTEDTDRLVFRLWANGPRASQAGGRIEIAAATVDGRSVTGTLEGDTVYVLTRPGGFAGGAPVEVELTFTLTMPGAINERIAKVGDALRLGSILPQLSWIRGRGWDTSPPVSNFSESVASEVADYDVSVTAPEGLTVLATGEEVEPGRFVAGAVRDWAATVAPMDLAEGTAQGGRTRVVVGVARGSGDDPQRRLADTVAALDDFAGRYGPYPYPVLTVGVTGSLSGGIEFPQHIQVGAGTSRDHLIHEVAHMWFYALVGNDQYDDPWLDEGLTEYAESRFLGNTGSGRAMSVPAYGRGRLGEGHDYWSGNTGAFFRSVYVQGLQALAAFGDEASGLEAVDCALRRYVLHHAYAVARPADLVAALEEQTGVDPRPVLGRYGVTGV